MPPTWSQPTGIDHDGRRRRLGGLPEVLGQRSHQLAERGLHLGGGRRRPRHEEQGASLVGGEAAEVGATTTEELPASVAALPGVDRQAGHAQRLEVPTGRALAHLELGGHLGRGHLPARLQEQQDGHQPIGSHDAILASQTGHQVAGFRAQDAGMFLLTSPSGASATLVRSNDDDPRPLLERALALATDVVATVGIDQLDDPTPCQDFDVRQLLEHLVDVVERIGEIGRGGDTRPRGRRSVRYVHDHEWLPAFCDAAAEAIDAWADDAVLDRIVALPWSARSGRATLATYLNEVTVHTWDLARATGQRPRLGRRRHRHGPRRRPGAHRRREAPGLRRRWDHDRPRLGPLPRTLRRSAHRASRCTVRPSARARRRRAPHRPPGGLERAPALTGLTGTDASAATSNPP